MTCWCMQIPRLVRMHSNELEDISEAAAGDIVAMFGVECASGDTFTDGSVRCGGVPRGYTQSVPPFT